MKILIATAAFFLAMTAVAEDSPLVAAAKRSKRDGAPKSTVVITNATLVRKGGHLMTTKNRPALPKLQSLSATETATSANTAESTPATPHRLDDAELDAVEGLRGDEIICQTCLPMLKPSATLPLRKAELSANPPAEVKPQPLAVVPPKPPRD